MKKGETKEKREGKKKKLGMDLPAQQVIALCL